MFWAGSQKRDRGDQGCHSAADTQMSMKMSSLSRLFLTRYEYHLSGLCLLSSELHNHIRTLSNCSWQPCSACYFAERKNGDICHLTPLKATQYESQPTLNGWNWCTQMFNDVQSSDAQCFIPLKLLKHNSLLAYSEERAETVTRHILSREAPVFFICILSPKLSRQ